ARSVAQGRQVLRKLLRGRVLMTPRDDGTVELSGQADYGKLFSGILLTSQQRWRPQRDSNPCFGLERATSWASGRWGRDGRNLMIARAFSAPRVTQDTSVLYRFAHRARRWPATRVRRSANVASV